MIIGITGLIGSGKGTVADILQNNHGFIKVSFADSLKDCVSVVFGWDRALLEGDTDESRAWREKVDPWWAGRLGYADLTPRWVLQMWGTEVCREGFHKDIWIASMEKKLSDHSKNYVIPDTRFPNEIDMIQRMDGQVWCVKRGTEPAWVGRYLRTKKPPVDIHPSEWEWLTSKFDLTVYNNGTIATLENIIKEHV